MQVLSCFCGRYLGIERKALKPKGSYHNSLPSSGKAVVSPSKKLAWRRAFSAERRALTTRMAAKRVRKAPLRKAQTVEKSLIGRRRPEAALRGESAAA